MNRDLVSSRRPANAADDLREVYDFLHPLSFDYPDFRAWYWGRVSSGVKAGTRRLLRVDREGELRAVGIAKDDGVEKKICTVRVSSNFANRGYGMLLFDQLLTWLDTDRPHLTVGAHKLPQFERIFDWYGFELSSSVLGRYRPGVLEHSFNGEDHTLSHPAAIAAASTASSRSARAYVAGTASASE